MAEKNSKEAEKPEVNLEFSGKGLLGGFLKGLTSLIDLADKVSKEGGKIERSGEFGVKGEKDVTGVYGFSIKTMTGPGGIGRPVVQPFGNLSKIKKTQSERPKGPRVEETREPLVDLFDEGDFIRVVAELPGVAESEVTAEVQGDDVLQIAATGKQKYSKEMLLPAKVEGESLAKRYLNGVLELTLKKKK